MTRLSLTGIMAKGVITANEGLCTLGKSGDYQQQPLPSLSYYEDFLKRTLLCTCHYVWGGGKSSFPKDFTFKEIMLYFTTCMLFININ